MNAARSRVVWTALAAVVVVALVVLVLTRGGGDDGARTAPPGGGGDALVLEAPASTTARCAVPDVKVLRQADAGFQGTVASVEDGRVTLDVVYWYTEDQGDQVVVDQPPADLQRLVGAADFHEGDRFLVAADHDHRLMVCGLTAPYSARLASLYAQAFRT